MSWLFIVAYFAVMIWFARSARERADEYAAAGLLRSPLYWITSLLAVTLLGLAMYMAHIHQQGPIPTLLLLLAWVLFVVVLLLRRALKWRYPI
ncbi:hypothetical protein [Bradyrhizobium liaoningense]|uniref:hypothetical protein n=1 Tax=Bradyrhizobium liaoningense TaxID=43992 RepID=UPI001BADC85B|nr:hypothetical protein [Bradyrhizobium liaoningense]MBR0717585.1 hypothetical protein [Bradyrhizobium liaoningense]